MRFYGLGRVNRLIATGLTLVGQQRRKYCCWSGRVADSQKAGDSQVSTINTYRYRRDGGTAQYKSDKKTVHVWAL
jgi:hypothetical protein